MRLLATIAAICALAGCAALEAPPPAPITYACDEGRSFSVIFHPSGESAIIEINQMRFTLRREPSGSGAKYACDVLVFWTKGSEAVVEMEEKRAYTNCRPAGR